METLGLIVHFLLSAALCMTFWNLLGKVSKQTRTLQAISFISLSIGFVFLTLLSILMVNWLSGSSTGGFEGLGLPVLTFAESLLVTPIMVVVGAGRLIWLNKNTDACQVLQPTDHH